MDLEAQLLSLIESRAPFNQIKAYVDQFPDSVSDATEGISNLPIFFALTYHPSLELIEVLANVYPASLCQYKEGGLTPLHLACERGVALDIIRFLVNKNKHTLKIPTVEAHNGALPIHCACRGACNLAVIRYLAEEYPESVMTADCHQCYPFHHACTSPNVSPAVIEFLLEKYSEAATLPSRSFGSGNSIKPLCMLLSQRDSPPIEVVRLLIRADPTVLTEGAPYTLPLHVICETPHCNTQILRTLVQEAPEMLKILNIRRNLAIHLVCKTRGNLRHDVIDIFLHHDPDSMKHLGAHDFLPLHYASQLEHVELSVVKRIVEAYPEALESPTVYKCLPLHNAAEKLRTNRELLEYLAQRCPKAGVAECGQKYTPLQSMAAEVVPLYMYEVLAESCPESLLPRVGVPGPIEHYVAQAHEHDDISNREHEEVCHFFITKQREAARQILKDDGWNPLHEAPMYKDIVRYMVRRNPQFLRCADRTGSLPLHYHVSYDGSHAITGILVANLYPDATRVKNNDGQLPIHIACKGDQPTDVLGRLISFYPEGLVEQDNDGRCPLHYAIAAKERHPAMGSADRRALDDEVCSPEWHACGTRQAVGLLLRKCGRAATIPDRQGITPLEFALLAPNTSLDILYMMLRAFPDALKWMYSV